MDRVEVGAEFEESDQLVARRGVTGSKGVCLVSFALCNMDLESIYRAQECGPRVWVHTNSLGKREIVLNGVDSVVRIADKYGEWIGHRVENVAYIEFESVNGSVLSFERVSDSDEWTVEYVPSLDSSGTYLELFEYILK